MITGKGVLNNRISEYLMMQLAEIGIPTHFVRRLNMREQLIREVEIIPLEVVVRNVAAGSLSKRLGIAEGTRLPRSIIEYYYKNDALGDPMVSEEHITAFGWASDAGSRRHRGADAADQRFPPGLFLGVGIKLVDFKLEFGRLWENDEMRIVLADEISPDNCRLWDIKTNEKMDKDRFRRDLGQVEEAYQEVARRLGILPEGGPRDEAPGRAVRCNEGAGPHHAEAGVLDPQGKAIGHALHDAGLCRRRRGARRARSSISSWPRPIRRARARPSTRCAGKLLANTVIESYRIELEG